MNLIFKTSSIKQAAKSRNLWFGLLFCWLFIANVATAHQQKHLFNNEFECQYCVSSVNNIPVIAADLINISINKNICFCYQQPQSQQIIIQAIELNSRGPPQS